MSSLGETPSGPGGFSETRQLTLGDLSRVYSSCNKPGAGLTGLLDWEDFDMAAIDAGHEEHLRSDARYRIPTPLLQSGVGTPSRGDTFYNDIPSRPPSPVPAWTAPSQSGSHASTPVYIPPQDNVLVGAQTPLFLPERDQTPLFLPSSHGPTPYNFDFCSETPAFFPTLVDSEEGRDSALRGLATASSPPRFHSCSLLDSDKEEDEETLSDKVHDGPQCCRPMFPEEDETEDDLCALAAAYEDAGVHPVPASTTSAPPVVMEDTFVLDTSVIPRYSLYKGLLALYTSALESNRSRNVP
ncbi:hypothetical protein B0H13DRAFT_1879975 [Mycena leptocephala]|nr:hypothetical protein B0H13DRAFT_1879975 [Mycena leptocephala]